MHESYDENDEDEYGEDQYNHDYPPKNPYQWYYKFDITSDSPVSKWFDDLINDFIKNSSNDYNIVSIPGFYSKKFPVNSWNPDTDKGNSFQYLGSNYQGSPIWKTEYFIIDRLNSEYKLHLQSHANHFVKQPHYYKSMFDILN